MYLTYHSYSQVMGYPWGYDYNVDPPKNEDQIQEMGNIAAHAMRNANKGRIYQVGNIAELIYPVGGMLL